MLGRAIIARKYAAILPLSALIFLTTACFTVVAKPVDRETSADSPLPRETSLGSVAAQPPLFDTTDTASTGIELVELSIGVEPATGGAVIVTPIAESVSDFWEDQMPKIADATAARVTDLVAVHQYPRGMQVRLEAVAEDGYWFSQWNRGCLRVSLNVCTLNITDDVYVGARFVKLSTVQNESGR